MREFLKFLLISKKIIKVCEFLPHAFFDASPKAIPRCFLMEKLSKLKREAFNNLRQILF